MKMLKVFCVGIVVFLLLFACQNPVMVDESRIDVEKAAPEKAPINKADRINSTSADSYEQDDSQAAAKTIIVNAAVQEHNYYDDASDWLQFSATAGQKYTIETWVYGSADTKLYLMDGTTQLAYNDDKGDGTYGSKITDWTAPSTKTYTIESYSYSGRTGTDRAYEISVTGPAVSGADAYEQDDTSGTANLIVAGASQDHNFFDDAADWVYFSGTSGKSYTIESFVQNSADTKIYLYNSSLTQLGYNDDKGDGTLGSKVEYSCTSTGTYYVKVTSYNDATGANREYSLSLTEGSGGGEITLPMAQKKWTIMVYLDGDNNLSSYSVSDVNEMKAVGSTDDFNIVLLWDDYSSRHGYYYVQYNNPLLLQDTGEVNMGSVQTATNFIDYVTTNFPADHYMWDFWNHGGAVDRNIIDNRGVCWDDTNSGDHLTEVEQLAIFDYFYNKIGKKVDIISYDACLMATAEIAYQFKDRADYLVGSEQLEPGDGWDYDFLLAVKNNPNITGSALASEVVDAFASYYSSASDVTLSAVALNSTLGADLDNFAAAARTSGISGSIYKNLAQSDNFAGYTKDLYVYMKNITNSSSVPSNVKSYAQNVMDTITASVINEWHDSTWTNKAYGLSITLKADTTTYSLLDLCVDTEWDEFLTFAGF